MTVIKTVSVEPEDSGHMEAKEGWVLETGKWRQQVHPAIWRQFVMKEGREMRQKKKVEGLGNQGMLLEVGRCWNMIAC